MNILHVAGPGYLGNVGGGRKGNRVLFESLAAHGHRCTVVASSGGRNLKDDLAVHVSDAWYGRDVRRNGVDVKLIEPSAQPSDATFMYESGSADVLEKILEEIRATNPPDIVVMMDDYHFRLPPAQASFYWLERVVKVLGDCCPIIQLCKAIFFLPFGPASLLNGHPEAEALKQRKLEILKKTHALLTICKTSQEYVRKWSGIEAKALYFPDYGSGPFEDLGNFDAPYVGYLNPSLFKGLPIFMAVAKALPDVQFAAIPSWATRREDLEQITSLPNVTLLESRVDVDSNYRQFKALLYPSMCYETWGSASIECMARGMPVVCSDSGGLPESSLGVADVIPTRLVERWEFRVKDGRPWMDGVNVPEQDPEPWIEAIRRLTTDRSLHRERSRVGRERALEFIRRADPGPIEQWLIEQAK